MKTKTVIGIGLLGLMLAGCISTAPQTPPTALDRYIFDVQTNLSARVVVTTNTVTQTNLVTQTVTNTQNQIVTLTNTVTQSVPIVITNLVPVTNYVFTPNATAQAISSTSGAVVSATGVPWGGLIGTVLAGAFGIWGSLRSRQATTSATVAANAAQIIEVARNIIKALPNGAVIGTAFDNWMMTHQMDANIANEVAVIVDKLVDPNSAQGVAQQLLGQAIAPLNAPPAPKA